jgi:hypothetical protein
MAGNISQAEYRALNAAKLPREMLAQAPPQFPPSVSALYNE